MTLTERYRERLLGLLPEGSVWRRDVAAEISKFFAAFAKEFARVDELKATLYAEATPWTSVALLPAWERVLALPSTGSIEERQAAVAAKLLDQGGVSIPYYVSLAAVLGYDIWIEEYLPWQVGISSCVDPLYGDAWMAAWTVHYIAGAHDALLEATLIRARQAHTRVLFERHDYLTIDGEILTIDGEPLVI